MGLQLDHTCGRCGTRIAYTATSYPGTQATATHCPRFLFVHLHEAWHTRDIQQKLQIESIYFIYTLQRLGGVGGVEDPHQSFRDGLEGDCKCTVRCNHLLLECIFKFPNQQVGWSRADLRPDFLTLTT